MGILQANWTEITWDNRGTNVLKTEIRKYKSKGVHVPVVLKTDSYCSE